MANDNILSAGKAESGAMSSAAVVARYIIAHVPDTDNYKLQTLLYYVQGVNLVLSGRSLFSDAIEARLLGPAVPDVFREYAEYEDGPIPKPDKEDIENIPEEAVRNINTALECFGQFSTWNLISRAHETAPWKDAYGKAPNTEISVDDIKAHFAEALIFEDDD